MLKQLKHVSGCGSEQVRNFGQAFYMRFFRPFQPSHDFCFSHIVDTSLSELLHEKNIQDRKELKRTLFSEQITEENYSNTESERENDSNIESCELELFNSDWEESEQAEVNLEDYEAYDDNSHDRLTTRCSQRLQQQQQQQRVPSLSELNDQLSTIRSWISLG